jgi:chitodextrinase
LAPGNEPPRAAITGTARLSVGRSATLNGGESSDPDGGIVSYAWYFGDGSTAGGTMAEKVFDRPGTYAVVLTVTDDGGLNAQAIRWLTVEP